jgi:hypothetical protein
LKADHHKGKIGKSNHENTIFCKHEIHSILFFVFLIFRDFVVNVFQFVSIRYLEPLKGGIDGQKNSYQKKS